MATEQIGDYEIECTAVPLSAVTGWAAHLAIYGPSANPMHRNNVFPEQRVRVETVFDSAELAEHAARSAALELLPHGNKIS